MLQIRLYFYPIAVSVAHLLHSVVAFQKQQVQSMQAVQHLLRQIIVVGYQGKVFIAKSPAVNPVMRQFKTGPVHIFNQIIAVFYFKPANTVFTVFLIGSEHIPVAAFQFGQSFFRGIDVNLLSEQCCRSEQFRYASDMVIMSVS
ncbi:unknown [Azospirillum sp. CAG:260]|nr:unknown [Azospirillum sp. CAG:260]